MILFLGVLGCAHMNNDFLFIICMFLEQCPLGLMNDWFTYFMSYVVV